MGQVKLSTFQGLMFVAHVRVAKQSQVLQLQHAVDVVVQGIKLCVKDLLLFNNNVEIVMDKEQSLEIPACKLIMKNYKVSKYDK